MHIKEFYKMNNTKNYSSQSKDSLAERVLIRKRREMMDIFLHTFPAEQTQNVLDVGVTADQELQSTNYFEKFHPAPSSITALSDQDASWLEDVYDGLTFQQGDARELPFPDKSFDVVFSSAVLEHVGNTEQQTQMIKEAVRVARKGVFITTPNRWHPVDFHTMVPLLHWLPKKWHRWCLKKIGLEFFSYEKHLNLLSARDIKKICTSLGLKNVEIKTISFLGFKSNLLLVVKL